VTKTFAALRLLPMSDRDKDTEILALHHQIGVLERRLGSEKVRFAPATVLPCRAACRLSDSQAGCELGETRPVGFLVFDAAANVTL
jgi:hypothetical protein